MFTVKPLSFAVIGYVAADKEYTQYILFYFPFTAASLFSLGCACWGGAVCVQAFCLFLILCWSPRSEDAWPKLAAH